MSKIKRFGVSVEDKLLTKFDNFIKKHNYPNRSEALRDLIRDNLISDEWKAEGQVIGIISLVYDHHKRELQSKSTHIQHHHYGTVLSSQHIHLDKNNCLEVIIVKGKAQKVKDLHNSLKSLKGVKHATLNMTTTAKNIS